MRKLTQEELNKVIKQAQSDYDEANGTLRWGQAFFNTLYELFPEVADSIRSGEYDPFFNSEKTVKCIDFISE